MPSEGVFFVLEGIDGSGTTTQAALLHEALRSRGHEVVLTREPTGGPVGRFLRTALSGELTDESGGSVGLDWASMALLFAADRVDHLQREILPALADGKIVISDRYDLSSLIYQSATCPEGEAALPWLRELNRRARRPELTIVLDLAPVAAELRRKARSGKEEIYEKAELQRRLAGFYKRSAEFLPRDSLEVLSGEGSKEEVAESILALVLPRLEFGSQGSGER